MYVGVAQLDLVIDASHSLKEKRMVIRRIKDRVRERLGVIVNEVGALDQWQRAQLGFAVVSGERGKAGELVDEVVRCVRENGDAQLVAVARELQTFDAEAQPYVAVDDRTGAGDKAQASDDWIPEAWREDGKA